MRLGSCGGWGHGWHFGNTKDAAEEAVMPFRRALTFHAAHSAPVVHPSANPIQFD